MTYRQRMDQIDAQTAATKRNAEWEAEQKAHKAGLDAFECWQAGYALGSDHQHNGETALESKAESETYPDPESWRKGYATGYYGDTIKA